MVIQYKQILDRQSLVLLLIPGDLLLFLLTRRTRLLGKILHLCPSIFTQSGPNRISVLRVAVLGDATPREPTVVTFRFTNFETKSNFFLQNFFWKISNFKIHGEPRPPLPAPSSDAHACVFIPTITMLINFSKSYSHFGIKQHSHRIFVDLFFGQFSIPQ